MRFNLVLHRLIRSNSVKMHKVFVYGTLKRGEPNHNWFETKENGYSKFLANGLTIKKYPLVIASKYNIPFLLHSPGIGENVIGEIYEVDEQMLSRLDVLENHPSFYVRDRDMIKVIPDKKNEDLVETEIECWIYFLKQFKPSLLSEPYLTEYHSEGDHAKPYTLPHNRVPGYQPKTDVLIT